MTALLPAERLDKLVKVCGLLSSSHDGERAAAALQASRIVKAAGLSWSDLLRQPIASTPRPEGRGTGWFDDVLLCQRHPGSLRPWETGFISSIGRLRRLTPKQRSTLAGIAATLRARGLR